MANKLDARILSRTSFVGRVVRTALVYFCVVIALFAGYFVYSVFVHGFDVATSGSSVAWFIKFTLLYMGLGLLAAVVSVSLQVWGSRMGK
jgi:hypothetical protein